MRVSAEKLVSMVRGARLPAMGILAVGALLTGCGDKSSNPDAVTVDSLKYPGNLVVTDKGNGEVWLSWTGSNNEKDFDGYNVYGMQGTPDTETAKGTLGVTEGKAVQLLDASGDKVADATNVLGNFNYDPKTGLESKGTGAASGSGSDAPEFSALPIHENDTDGTTPILPTCKPAAGTCTAPTAANKDTTAGDDPTYAVNGTVSYKVPKTLVPGESYCFLVMSSEDNGKKISQTSSNVACVVPKFKADFTVSAPASSAGNLVFDLRAFLTACGTGTCPATPQTTGGAITVATDAHATGHVAGDAGPLYIETASGVVGFVAGKATAINDLGFYANGFSDSTLSWIPPTLILDDAVMPDSSNDKGGPIFNAGGYSVAGQTVPVVANHVYVVAVGATDATGVGPFNYHWLYVTQTPTPGSDFTVSMLLTKTAQ